MSGRVSTPGASVVSRAFALLGAFDERHRALTLSDLARRAGLPLATTHRLVAELVAVGALARRESGHYVIGRRIWSTGLLAPVQTGLRELASPFLHDIFAATRATVHLAVREGTEVLYLERLRGNESVPIVSRAGGRLPLHSTGVGKVLLAHAPEDVRTWVFTNLTRITPFTVTQPGRLRAELRRVLRDGYAQTSEEMSLGACSVAVPIYRSVRSASSAQMGDGSVVASLGIVVPTLGRDRPRLVAALQVAAQGIGRSLPLSESR
jgi:DNA-binding IclR family transcriptional regulator